MFRHLRAGVLGLRDKLMGQVIVVLAAQRWLTDGGCFTLTSGITAHAPVRDGTNASTVNLALEGFVRGPTFGPHFPGFEPVSSARVGLADLRSIEGGETGRVYRAGH